MHMTAQLGTYHQHQEPGGDCYDNGSKQIKQAPATETYHIYALLTPSWRGAAHAGKMLKLLTSDALAFCILLTTIAPLGWHGGEALASMTSLVDVGQNASQRSLDTRVSHASS